jgi:benzoyl-CoA reductase/2-hydroxyglutaryl-CoA dehydratase subunit BcrC/BadD/HgdB
VTALDELLTAYADRSSTATRARRVSPPPPEGRWHHSTPLIGYVGADVPVELITAAGAVPLRLFGDPSGDPESGLRYLGGGVDPAAVSVLSGLLAGVYPIDTIVVSHDCEASLRLFYALRELRRIEPSRGLPEIYLVDIAHLPHHTTTAYNTVRIGQFRDRLADWTGHPVDDDALLDAIGRHDRQRDRLTELARLRHREAPALTGTEFLAVVGAGTAMTVDAHAALLDRLLAEPPSTPAGARRVFLTGSGHDTADVYRALEDRGMTIVGEDHDWGELLFARRVFPQNAAGDPVEALAERYQYNGPSAARSTVRARAEHTARRVRECGADMLICYARRQDDAPRWDFARQAMACGLPTVVAEHQAYGQVLLPEMADAA